METKWQVLLIGGSSGIGKSRLAKKLAKEYDAKIIEADDICCSVKAMTTEDTCPAIHYWMGDMDWRDAGIDGNVDWLTRVSAELTKALKAIVESHLNGESKLIVEGDFISADYVASFDNPKVKGVFIYEKEKDQIIKNYLNREGGKAQTFRADISYKFGMKLKDDCDKQGIDILESRPWHTLPERVIKL